MHALDWRIAGSVPEQIAKLPSPLNLLSEDIQTGFAYRLGFGLPSGVMLMPYALAFGGKWVSTASAFELTLLA
jgi:hypothetical protein